MSKKDSAFVPSYNPAPTAPRRMPPPGSWDTHFHVFEPEDTDAADATAAYSPFTAPMAALDHMHKTIGIDRGVLIQATSVVPVASRFAAQVRSNPRLRGVAVMDDKTTDAELALLHDAGVRGVRFHFASFLKKRPDMAVFLRSADRVAELGWHVKVHLEIVDIPELAPILAKLPATVVIDHIGQVRVRDGAEHPGFQSLLDLHRHEHCWIQLGNSDRWSATGAPSYADALPFGQAVIKNAPSRVLWGTDWPHVMYKDPRAPGDAPPDEADLMNLMFDFAADDDAVLRQVLVDNPLRLYKD